MPKFSSFNHGKKSVVWLKPLTSRPNALVELQTALEAALPGFNELSSKSADGFHAHMTIGQFATQQAESKMAAFQSILLPIEFEVTEIFMINRDGDVPFQVIDSLKLGPSK
eukprot:gene11196-13053_t